MKTTNAKARAFQTPGGLDTEHKPLQPTSTRPLRQKIKPAESSKLEVHADSPLRIEDRGEPEYCPPNWIEPPYVNDDIDVESLDYSIVHREAQSKAFAYKYGGASARRKVEGAEEAAQRRMAREDEEFLRRMENDEIVIEDIPETHPKRVLKDTTNTTRAPLHQRSTSAIVRKPTTTSRTANPTQPASTIASRRAASALSNIDPTLRTTSSRPATTSTLGHSRSASSGAPLAKKPLPFGLGARKPAVRTTGAPASSVPNTMRATSAMANSRSTVGYNKGRTASTTLNSAFEPTSTSNSVSAARPDRPSSRGGMSSGGLPMRPRIGLQRSATTISTGSGESTLTPAKWARQNGEDNERTSGSLLEAFACEEEENPDDLGVGHIRLGGEVELPDCLKPGPDEKEEEEFVMTLNF